MTAPHPAAAGRPFLVALVALLPAAGPLAAQDADFLFKRPMVSVGIHAGWAGASAGSDIFDMTIDTLTVSRGDFSSGLFGAELAIRATEQLDVSVDLSYARSETRSEYRNWVDQDDLPIEQTTVFRRTPLTVSLKYYLRERGRSIGRFAWIPAQWSPYVGVGGGWTWYRFEQAGDWVDFQTLDIFTQTFASDGQAPTAHVLAGAEVPLGPRFSLTGEGRYSWASTEMDRDFVGFDKIDLGGFQLTVGVAARF